jgi:long-chain acyl-CoA synthetase
MYERQVRRELAGMLDDAEVKLVLVDKPELKRELEDEWRADGRIVSFDEAFAPQHVFARPPLARDDSDYVTMVYTSGTSSEPKGVLYNVRNVDYVLPQIIEALRTVLGRTMTNRVFHYAPFCFAASRIQLWSQLSRGNPVMISTDLNNVVQEMSTAAPNYIVNVPTLLERIKLRAGKKLEECGGYAYALYCRAVDAYQRTQRGQGASGDSIALALAKRLVFPIIRAQIGKNLEFLICGSAPLNEDTQLWFQMIGIPVYQIYGLTETTAIVSMDRKGQARAGYVGRSIEGVELKISEDRELLVRGPNIFVEYWKRPEATANALADGWFHTGDMAELTPSGDLKIIGRLKDLLVPESGYNVAPAPIEEKLSALLPGAQVMLVGHARPYLAAIFTGVSAQEALQSAVDQLNQQLPHYRRVRRWFIAPEPFSVENGLLSAATQRLKRLAVEKHYARQIDGLYA